MISPLAYIHPEAVIGENCEIGPFCYIDKNVVIGDINELSKNELKDIIDSLNQVLNINTKVTICLETMAGKGSEIGSRFEELKQIIDGVTLNEKLGVCLDTCHVNDAGYYVHDVDELLEELEEVLVMSDIGMETSVKIIDDLRVKIKKEKIEDEQDVKKALKEIMKEILEVAEPKLNLETKPSIILVIGVNGVGKTTSIGKIANNLVKQGKKVVVAAADTFRAAAVEQLDIWAKRSGSIIVKKDEGSDPAWVVYDAIQKTYELGADVLIVDTAGRLHNKKYLMDELFKINKVIEKEMSDVSKEVLLVLDAETGQNAINQVKAFKETTDITGIVLTKLDGTAKGGVVLGIVSENHIPVKFIGVGEQIDDMQVFNSTEFLDAII